MTFESAREDLRDMIEEEGCTEEVLEQVLSGLIAMDGPELGIEPYRVRTFWEAGLMTRNKGIEILLEDGTEFQITIIQSR